MNGTKIQFSVAEMELMNNADIILTKNNVIRKIKNLFEQIQGQMLNEVNRYGIAGLPLFTIAAKISRGENYSGLPYLILDYPRQFDGNNIIAIRTLFWWGNFFSSTLHLSGAAKTKYLSKVEQGYEALSNGEYYIGNNADQWQHHFATDNYKSVKELSKEIFTEHCRQNDHIKIAAKCALADTHIAANKLLKNWQFFFNLLSLTPF